MMKFGENLRNIRITRKLSQEELATLLGTTKQVISRYENNQRSPKVSVVADFAEKLGVSIGELTGDTTSVPHFDSSNESEGLKGELTSNSYSSLDPTETELLTLYRDLNTIGQQALLGTARGLHNNPDMKKGSESNPMAI